MKQNLKNLIIGVAIIASAWLLGRAYTYKFRAQDTIVVTGLGETEFASDLIVWDGEIVYETLDVATGYAQLERNKQKVLDFITSRGVAEEQIVFKFVNVYKQSEPVYNANGNYSGQRFTGYRLSQGFSIESSEVDKVE
ncbi:MAG: SIMPL domain-containing protein, partial [Alistipes sp.]|nr:SIMPL domain-containing protein [Alistipes sp.]